ncbi:MAG: DnaA/Hda family protein [Planctomycetota bacterium]
MEADPRIDALRRKLQELLGAERFSVWFDDAVRLGVEGPAVTVTAPSAFQRDRLRKQFHKTLTQAAQACCMTDAVEYRVSAALPDEARAKATSKAGRPARERVKTEDVADEQAKPATVARPFDGWVTNDSAAEAETACRQIVDGQLHASPILLWGRPGVGKTHLLHAVADGVRRRMPKRRVLLITAEQFIVGFVAAIRGAGLPSFRQKHRGVGLLLLDNAHQLLGKQRTTEEFLSTLDHIAMAGGQVVLTSDRSPTELAEMGPELASRFAGGVSAPIQMPDVACRVTLIDRAAAERGIELPPRARDALATSLNGGAREVSGALNRLGIMQQAFALPIDEELARRVAAEINQLATPRVGIRQIEAAVCDVFGVGPKELRSSKRTKAVTEPRMLAMYLSRKLTGSAWSEIGDHFGKRSHSTAIAAHRRVERLLASGASPRLAGQAGDLHDAIRRVESALRIA